MIFTERISQNQVEFSVPKILYFVTSSKQYLLYLSLLGDKIENLDLCIYLLCVELKNDFTDSLGSPINVINHTCVSQRKFTA